MAKNKKVVTRIYVVHGWVDLHIGTTYDLTFEDDPDVKNGSGDDEPDFTDWQLYCPSEEMVKDLVKDRGYTLSPDVEVEVVDTGA